MTDQQQQQNAAQSSYPPNYPDSHEPTTRWRIVIRQDSSDNYEHVELTNLEAHAFWMDGGVVIRTRPTGFGDFHDERVVPWAQVIDFAKEEL